VGDEIWEMFGHTGVRVVDSIKHRDIVYNYGTFDGFEKDFELKFMRGKLLYYVSVDPYDAFMSEYVQSKRIVEEQVLMITDEQKETIFRFLDSNALPANRAYKYDFYYDNCATRIRDIFPKVLGTQFHFGRSWPADKLTFRNITDKYLYRVPFTSFGINLLLGSKVDKVMSNKDVMFLPDFLRDGLAGSSLSGHKVPGETQQVLSGSPVEPEPANYPLLLTVLLALLTLAGLIFNKLRVLGSVMTFFMLFSTGLLGCLMLFMWFGTDHQACGDNFNILWALPTNIVLAFKRRPNGRYAIMAILLLLTALVIHILKVQELPILQIGPILLALLYIYGTIYKRSIGKIVPIA